MQPRLRALRTPVSACIPANEPPVTRQLGSKDRRTVSLSYGSPSPEDDLREAIDDESLFKPTNILARPPIARLAPSRDLHYPQLLNSLARSTLPSARLTTPPPVHIPQEASEEPGIVLEQSPPIRTSIDSLRTLRDRGKGPQPPSPQKSTFSTSALSNWWFQPENKAAVDQLLEEEDRESTAEGETAQHRRKCE